MRATSSLCSKRARLFYPRFRLFTVGQTCWSILSTRWSGAFSIKSAFRARARFVGPSKLENLEGVENRGLAGALVIHVYRSLHPDPESRKKSNSLQRLAGLHMKLAAGSAASHFCGEEWQEARSNRSLRLQDGGKPSTPGSWTSPSATTLKPSGNLLQR